MEEVAEWDQSSQVDLLAKSKIFDGAVVRDAAGVTPLGSQWGHGPPRNFENWK